MSLALRIVLTVLVLAVGCELAAGIPDERSQAADAPGCKEFCDLATSLCMDDYAIYASKQDCLNVCALYRSEDLSCREEQLRLAKDTLSSPRRQCANASLSGGDSCAGRPQNTILPTCSDYCQMNLQACTNDGDKKHKLYESVAECLSACQVMPPGDFARDETSNTVACRSNRSYDALSDPGAHCPRAGPGGAGVCGDDCESLCTFLERACSEDYQALYEGSRNKCEMACDAARWADPSYLDGQNYSIDSAKRGEDFACRMYHAVQATAQGNDADDACSIAVGRRACPFKI